MVQSKTELFETGLTEKANLFKALAHPARLRILQFLSETKTCITGDISDELPLGRTTVNQHLKELKNVGLIDGHIEGVKTKYCLNPLKIEQLRIETIDFLNRLQLDKDFECK
jgi:DNA-binding transcriptional ArsR family regulator